MYYIKQIDKGKMIELFEKGCYRDLVKIIIEEITYNYKRAENLETSGSLEKIWNDLVYIPDLEEMPAEVEKSLLDYVIIQRAIFRAILQKI